MPSDDTHSTGGSEKVWYDEMSAAFVGERIEKDGISIEIEAIKSALDDPRDDDSRFSLEVRARSLSPESDNAED